MRPICAFLVVTALSVVTAGVHGQGQPAAAAGQPRGVAPIEGSER